METRWILGSHNSMTYLSAQDNPVMMVASPLARCQDLTYQQQYEFGVRYFDLRIRFKDGSPLFAHGAIEFGGVLPDEVLAYLEARTGCWVNLVLENTSEINRSQDEAFIAFCRHCEKDYPHVQFVGGWTKFPDNDKSTPGGHPVIYHFTSPGIRRIDRYKIFSELNQMINDLRNKKKVDIKALLEALKEFFLTPHTSAEDDNSQYWKEWLSNPAMEHTCLMMDFVELGAPDSWKEAHPYTKVKP